jgi:hypothetical protein
MQRTRNNFPPGNRGNAAWAVFQPKGKNIKTRNNFPPVFRSTANYNASNIANAKWKAYLNKLKYSPNYGLTIANTQKLAALNNYWRKYGHTRKYSEYKHILAMNKILVNQANTKFVQNLLNRYGIRTYMPPFHLGNKTPLPSLTMHTPAGTYTIASRYVNNLKKRRHATTGKANYALRTRVAGMPQPPWPNINKPARMQRGINATREGLQRILNSVRKKANFREQAKEWKQQFNELQYLRRTYGPNKRLKTN